MKKNKNRFKKYLAFSLSEILIAMAVLGVIATITVPLLNNDGRDTRYEASFKKTYQELSDVFHAIYLANGSTMLGAFPNEDSITDTTREITTDISQYFKVLKMCLNFSNKFQPSYCKMDSPLKTLDGVTLPVISAGYYTGSGFLTQSGALIYVLDYWKTCNQYIIDTTIRKRCAEILIDANGFKKPNVVGIDTFRVQLHVDGTLNTMPITDTRDANGYSYARRIITGNTL